MKNKITSVSLCLILLLNLSLLPVYPAKQQYNKKQTGSIELANKYAESAHLAFEHKKYLKAGQDFEKAYSVSKHRVYLDNSTVAYMSYVYELTNNKNYNEALKYCNKVLNMQPNNANAKEHLADIFYSRGSDFFYAGEFQKAKTDLKNSLKFSSSGDNAERVKEALAQIEEAERQGLKPVSGQSSDNSVPQLVGIIENKVYGTNSTNQPLLKRIDRLEKDTFGKTWESDGLIVRVDRLQKTVLPEYAAKQNPVYGDNNYIREIIEQSMGRVTIFGKMPITVFINSPNVKNYRKFYEAAVKEGFGEWEKASENKIKFQYINDPSKADIQVVWQEEFEDFPWKPNLQKEDISAEKERMKYRKANAAVQIGSLAAVLAGGLGLPIIGGIGAIGGGVASPYLQYKGTKIDKLSPDIKINTKITQGMTDEAARSKIKQIATHQMGHTIGIFGHSSDSKDIMFENFTALQLSERDINTIREIYKSKEPVK